ncbi:hypothetical protein SAMN05518863_101616 [Candidatus Pantoea symbiotica]|jgi:hypothetical protein|uniref:Uncharacterized protein n=1 Tax=Candidatus Pantoea symbiotica TaxID=1884370 RepID=A0A1I3RN48_9GAMM|nr:hypothetical protein SAMN05518863_101616 [Pantoea symbiotica]SFU40142.1 hypothetical protein SAMN05518864_101616 [Pantoea sp. YR525]
MLIGLAIHGSDALLLGRHSLTHQAEVRLFKPGAH